MEKDKTIFDLLSDLNFNKVPWEEQSERERKLFSPYMVNRFLSMDYNLVEMVNMFQQYTPILGAENSYKMYYYILPRKKFFARYIGSKNKGEAKFEKLTKWLSEKYELSRFEAEEFLERIYEDDDGYMFLVEEIKKYGYTDKQIKKEFNL